MKIRSRIGVIASGMLASLSVTHGQVWQYQSAAGFTSGQVYSMCEYDPDGSGGIGKKVVAIGSFTTSSSGVTGLNRVAAWNGTNWEPMGAGISTDLSTNSQVITFDFDGAGPLGNYVVVRSQSQFSVSGQPAGYAAVWNGTTWSPLDVGGGTACLAIHDIDGTGPLAPQLYAGGGGVWRVGLTGAPVQVGTRNAIRMCSMPPSGVPGEPPVLIMAEWQWGGGMYAWNGTTWNALPSAFSGDTCEGLVAVDLDGDGPLSKQLVSSSRDGLTAYVGLHVWSVGLGSVSRFALPFPGAPWYFSPASSGGPIGEVDLDGVGPGRAALYAVLRVNGYQNDQHCAIGVLDGDGSIVPSQGNLIGVNLFGRLGEQQGPKCLLVFDHDDSYVTPPQMFVGGNVTYAPAGQSLSYGVLRREQTRAIPFGKWTYSKTANHICYGGSCIVGHQAIAGPVPMPTYGEDSDQLLYSNGALSWNLPMEFSWFPGGFQWHSYDAELRHGSGFAGWLTPHVRLDMTAYSAGLPGTRHRRTQRATAFLSATGWDQYGSLTAKYNDQQIAHVGVGADDGEFVESVESVRSYAAQQLDSIPGVLWTNMGNFMTDLSGYQNISFPNNTPQWVGTWDADGEVSVAMMTGTNPTVQILGDGSLAGASGSLPFSALAEDGDGVAVGINGFGITYYQWLLDGQSILAGPTASVVEVTFPSPGTQTLTLRVTDDEGNTSSTSRDVGTCVFNPALTQEPEATSVCGSGTAQFHAVGSGPGITYSWQYETADAPDVWTTLANGTVPGLGTVSGAGTGTLGVTSPQSLATGAAFRAVVANACGNVKSSPALLSVCRADFNCDSFLDFTDFDGFVFAFESGSADGDFNGDGFFDFTDFDEFVVAFEGGCSSPETPTGLFAQDVRDTNVTLEWNNGGSGADSYRIYSRAPGGVWQLAHEAPAGSSSGVVDLLTPSTDVCFKIRAVRADGSRSVDSSEVCVRTAPARPTDVRVTDIARTSAIVRWTDASSDETGFVIAIRRADNNQLVIQLTADPNTSARRVPRAGDVPAQLVPDTLYTVTVRSQRNCCPNSGTSGLGTPGSVQFRTDP